MRSTWIRTFAFFLVSSTSTAESCVFPLVKAGMCNLDATDSAISKPRSANTTSPGSNFCKIPQCSVRYLSLTHPPHASNTNPTTPWGKILIKTFAVFLCL